MDIKQDLKRERGDQMASAHARRSDPLTSHLAAASVMDLTATQLYILESFGNGNGFTDDELIKYYGSTYGRVHPASDSSIRSRRSELVDRGKLVDTGRTRPTAFGRASTVWDLAGRLF